MRRARHVPFVALAGHGHVTPTLPLVEEHVQRGHRVAYAAAADFAGVVTGAGAQWVQLPPMAPFRPPAQVGAANADRVVELGLGERLTTNTLSPDALRQAVSRVTTDEQVRTNLERMRRAIRDAGGAERGAALIEDHLA